MLLAVIMPEFYSTTPSSVYGTFITIEERPGNKKVHQHGLMGFKG
jgi:hypothetical protein